MKVCYFLLGVLFWAGKLVEGHGALSFPPSRQWQCSGGASPNLGVGWGGANGLRICSADVHAKESSDMVNTVITDWSGKVFVFTYFLNFVLRFCCSVAKI